MNEILTIAWERFKINSAVIADGNGRFIATLFYFTILVPFGVLSALFADPLRRKGNATVWVEREAVPTDLKSAREQG